MRVPSFSMAHKDRHRALQLGDIPAARKPHRRFDPSVRPCSSSCARIGPSPTTSTAAASAILRRACRNLGKD